VERDGVRRGGECTTMATSTVVTSSSNKVTSNSSVSINANNNKPKRIAVRPNSKTKATYTGEVSVFTGTIVGKDTTTSLTLPDGQGLMKYDAEDEYYYGSWKKGKRNGRGVAIVRQQKASSSSSRNDTTSPTASPALLSSTSRDSSSNPLLPPIILSVDYFVYEGEWENDILVKGTSLKPTGRYEGEFNEKRQYHGYGKLW